MSFNQKIVLNKGGTCFQRILTFLEENHQKSKKCSMDNEQIFIDIGGGDAYYGRVWHPDRHGLSSLINII